MIYTSKKKTRFFYCLLLLSFLSHRPEEKTTNHNHTVNNNPTIASHTFNTEINPQFITNTSSVINAVGIKISDITVIISNFFSETVTKENYHLLKDLIKQLLWKNRYKIVGSTLLGSYTATSFLLYADYYQLQQNIFWAHWKKQLSFEELCSFPQKELARELLLSIGQHNFNRSNPTDLAYPLIDFIKEIDKEIGIIKRYITTNKVIKCLRLMPIFPTNENKLAIATQLLERAIFIKHIFLSWLADYNLTMAEKMNVVE